MAKTITFKDGADLDRIDALLSGTRLRNRMPKEVAGFRSKMVSWAIEYLSKLVDGGVDNLQSELFTNNSEEWEVITRENDQLKEKLKAYEPVINKLAEVRKGVFQIKQDGKGGWVITIQKAHPLYDEHT